jgi:hypothetical protein
MSSSHHRGGHTAGLEMNLTKAPGLSRAPFLDRLARPHYDQLDQALAPFRTPIERNSSLITARYRQRSQPSHVRVRLSSCSLRPMLPDVAFTCIASAYASSSSHSLLTAPSWLYTARSKWSSASTSVMGAHALLTRSLRLADNCNSGAQSCQPSLLCNPKRVGWPHRAANMA